MRVTAKVKEATERAILTAARKLFVRNGFEGTNMRQVAAAAKIAVGTIFNYFPSKEALALAIAADGFGEGRAIAQARFQSEGHKSIEEDLFTLVAGDIRALTETRGFVREVMEAGLSPFMAVSGAGEVGAIRSQRLEDASAVLAQHGMGKSATGPVMHLYWSLYLGVLSYWAADQSPKQEDTWALLDQSVRMFAGSLRGKTPESIDVPEVSS